MIKIILIASIVLIGTAAFAANNLLLLGVGSNNSGGSGCSNSLDFSDPCNSQYIPGLL
jgi:hypothetical protein